jgi:protein-S-isoprenylcysteine O-methyltransferase Ste14
MELFVRFYEERRLARTYPEEYEAYRKNVRRWLPRLTPWRAPRR